MNTKKFIKRVNKLGNYQCDSFDEDDFIIKYYGDDYIKVQTFEERFKFYSACTFDVDNGTDRKLLKLLRKYLSSAEQWKKPQLEWFKRGLDDE